MIAFSVVAGVVVIDDEDEVVEEAATVVVVVEEAAAADADVLLFPGTGAVLEAEVEDGPLVGNAFLLINGVEEGDDERA